MSDTLKRAVTWADLEHIAGVIRETGKQSREPRSTLYYALANIIMTASPASVERAHAEQNAPNPPEHERALAEQRKHLPEAFAKATAEPAPSADPVKRARAASLIYGSELLQELANTLEAKDAENERLGDNNQRLHDNNQSLYQRLQNAERHLNTAVKALERICCAAFADDGSPEQKMQKIADAALASIKAPS